MTADVLTQDQPKPIRQRRKRRWLLAAMAAVLLLAGGIAVTYGAYALGQADEPPVAAPPVTFNAGGSLRLPLDGATQDRETSECTGRGGYDDIHMGTQVVVSDAAGATIAVGKLGKGHALFDGIYLAGCSFPFGIADIPAGKGFYGVTVGRRGTLKYTEAQMAGSLDFELS